MCSEHRRLATLSATLWVLVGGLMSMYLVLFVLCAFGRLMRPLDEFTYGESWLLDGARQVALGQGLYAAADHVPLMHIAYTPIYYLLVGGLQRFVGDNGYTTGRVVSLVATLVGTGALAWTIKSVSGRWSIGLLGAGLFLTQNMTALLWAPMHRVDPLALALTLVGLALATAGRMSIAAGVFLLALFTKQTFIVAPVAVAITLWPCRVRLWRYLAVLLVGGGVLLVATEWLTNGWFLWHTVVANNNRLDLLTFAALMGSFLQFNGILVLAALVSFAVLRRPGERLWRIYFVGCLATLPALAKLGASSNYWLEISAAVAVLLALGAHHLTSQPLGRVVAPLGIAGALLIALPGYQATASEAGANILDLLQPPAVQYLSLVGDGDAVSAMRIDKRFADQLAREPGELLTDNSGLAVAAGKRIEFEFQIFQLLIADGHWSEQPILDAVAGRRFSVVALMHPLDGPVDGTRWTRGLQEALRAAYVPAGQQAGFWLYRPRPG
jgi:branched-subunit amino acid transport protein